MQKKTLFLVGLVVLIWGGVSFRFFKSLYQKTPIIHEKNIVSRDVFVIKKKDSLSPLSSYDRDPFFGTKKKIKPRKRNTKRKKLVEWPDIEFRGQLQNLKTRKQVFFVVFKGQLMAWEQGKFYDSIQFVKGYSDRILVRYSGVQKTIKSNAKITVQD